MNNQQIITKKWYLRLSMRKLKISPGPWISIRLHWCATTAHLCSKIIRTIMMGVIMWCRMTLLWVVEVTTSLWGICLSNLRLRLRVESQQEERRQPCLSQATTNKKVVITRKTSCHLEAVRILTSAECKARGLSRRTSRVLGRQSGMGSGRCRGWTMRANTQAGVGGSLLTRPWIMRCSSYLPRMVGIIRIMKTTIMRRMKRMKIWWRHNKM